MANERHNPELIRNGLFARCKLYWGAGLTVKFLVFILGVIVVVAPVNGKFIAITGLVAALASEYLMWRADRWKGAAHGLHRKIDFQNSFGWPISESELMDYLARYPGDLEELKGKSTGSYFASDKNPGPKRAFENVRESAWWSVHLSESMFWCSVVVIVAIFAGCVMLLNVSVGDLANSRTVAAVSPTATLKPADSSLGVNAQTVKIVTSAILFIFSFGLFKFATGYFSFSLKAKQIKDSAESFLKSDKFDEIQAIKLWQDYHLAREAAPIIPTWIWRLREKRLNSLWNCYVKEQDKT